MSNQALQYDLLVVGDEVESILTAVSAARAGVRVALARSSQGRLGGLSVRGGLSYMDITPEYVAGLFQEFLTRSGVMRVALNPDKAHSVLEAILQEAGIEVYSGVFTSVNLDSQGAPTTVDLHHPNQDAITLSIALVIDATPDADMARALGIPHIKGLGGLLGEEQDLLGISPVFRIQGVSVEALQAFEAQLRAQPNLAEILAQALPYHAPELRAEYITRPTYAPPEMDYLDVLNPVIGIDYHGWRHGDAVSYPEAGILIDGGNISRLSDGTLGFNGLVAKADALNLDFDALLALSQGGPIPNELLEEMRHFERYLREKGGFAQAKIIPPEALYVRQTVTLLAQQNMTARHMLSGGVPPEQSVGTFSYWLDLRGTQLWKKYPGEHLPKPVFNMGLAVCLPLNPALQNFAFVSRSAGYSPIGQGAGRIIQHNALLGEGLGIAAALAALSGESLSRIVESAMPQIQEILKSRRSGKLEFSGQPTASEDMLAASTLLNADDAAIEQLRASATNCLLF